MEAGVERAYLKLSQNLEDLIHLYRQLLNMVRHEKELLISADADELSSLSLQKEQTLQKIRLSDTLRQKHAQELAVLIKAESENPRLLELAQKLDGAFGDRLRQQHSTLDLVIKRVVEINKENEEYAKQALNQLDGALGNIKETLAGKKTYGQQGKMRMGPEHSGHFVKKEI